MELLTKIKQRGADFLLIVVLAALPFSIKVTNIAALLLVGVCLLSADKNFIEKILRHKNALIITTGPFLFLALSLCWTSDLTTGSHVIEKSVMLFAFPIVFATVDFSKPVDFYLKFFAGLVVAMCLGCMLTGIYRFWFVDVEPVGDFFSRIPTRWNAITNTNLTFPFLINPIYFSLYVSFAIFIVAFRSDLKFITRATVVIFLFTFQVLLGSRLGLMALVFGGVASIFFTPARYRRYLIIAGVTGLLALVLSIKFNPVLQQRYISDLNTWKLPEELSGWNAVNIRHAIWKCSKDEFTRSPVYGSGAGGAAAGREECYKQYSFYGHFGTDFNSHNQYIEYGLAGGVILLGLFLLQSGYSARLAISGKNGIHFLFLLVFLTVAFGESLLEAHKGIIFFSCFNSMFIFSPSTHAANV